MDEVDFSLLPEELRHLAPLITRYAKSDDLKRTELIEAASDDELRELADAPTAHWDAINEFLDDNVAAHPGAQQDVALALDSFSQAAMEARYALERRGGD